MRVRVLGAVEAEIDGAAVAITSPKQRIVLARLVAAGREPVSVDALVDAIWGDDAPPSAVGSLHAYVSRLRGAIGGGIERRAGGYELRIPADQVDVWHFETLLARATEHDDPHERAAELRGALDLWCGDPFADTADRPGIRGEARRLTEERRRAVRRMGAALLECGDPERATSLLEAEVVDAPLDEGLWVMLVRALAAARGPGEALRAYQRAANALAEAGLEPSTELRAVEHDVVSPTDRRAPGAASSTPRTPSTGRSTTSFLGREDDLRQLIAHVAVEPITTVTGPGGVGKSRLVQELVATHAPEGYTVVTVELGALTDGAGLAEIVIDALGLTADADPGATLGRASATPNVVVLDNCEHLVDEVAHVVAMLCRPDATIRVIATSREVLGVANEVVYELRPLRSGPDGSGRALFIDRARRAGREKVDDDIGVIDQLVERLDGLPLAIEMAAARVRTRSVRELLGELHDHSGRLRSAERHAPARHRSLDNVVEWSYGLLEPSEAELYADLAVFAGRPSSDQVAAVTGRDPLETRELLDALCNRSLVTAHPGDPTRFSMLQTVRDHGLRVRDATPDAESLVETHGRWFAGFADDRRGMLFGPSERTAMDDLEASFDDLRAAHRWANVADPELAARMALTLHEFAEMRLRFEVHGWAWTTAEVVGDAVLRGELLASVAAGAAIAGELDRALDLLGRAEDLIGPDGSMLPLEVRSDVLLYQGDLAGTALVSAELRRRSEAARDPFRHSLGVVNGALALAYGGDRDGALSLLDEAETEDTSGSPTIIGWRAYCRGEVLLEHDPEAALQELDRAIRLANEAGNRFLLGVAEVSAISVRARRGDPSAAIAPFITLIDEWRRRAAWTHQLTGLRNLVHLLDRLHDHESSAILLGAVTQGGLPPTFGNEAARLNELRQRLARSLTVTGLDAALARGRALTPAATVAFALERLGAHDPILGNTSFTHGR